MMNSVFFFRGAVGAFNTKYFFPLNLLRSANLPATFYSANTVLCGVVSALCGGSELLPREGLAQRVKVPSALCVRGEGQ